MTHDNKRHDTTPQSYCNCILQKYTYIRTTNQQLVFVTILHKENWPKVSCNWKVRHPFFSFSCCCCRLFVRVGGCIYSSSPRRNAVFLFGFCQQEIYTVYFWGGGVSLGIEIPFFSCYFSSFLLLITVAAFCLC